MMKLDIGAILILLFLGFIFLFRNILILPSHWDESYLFNTQWRYDNFFHKQDISKKDWPVAKDDHPPMADYILGAVLDLTGYSTVVNSYGLFTPFTFDFHKDLSENITDVSFAIPFLIGRITMAVIALGSVFLLYSILRLKFSASISLISSILLLINPLFLQVSPRLFLESPLGFFFIGSLLFLVLWVKNIHLFKQYFAYSIFVGLFCGLCYLTKLNGLFSLEVSLIVVTAFWIIRQITLKMFFISISSICVMFTLVVTFLFPPFLYNPHLHLDFITWRKDIVKVQQSYGPHYSIWQSEKYRPLEFNTYDLEGKIEGPIEAGVMVVYRLLWYYDPIRRTVGFPLFVILFLANGIYFIPKFSSFKNWRKHKFDIALLIWGIVLFATFCFTLALDWERYYYLMLFPTIIFLAYGMRSIQIVGEYFFVTSRKKVVKSETVPQELSSQQL